MFNPKVSIIIPVYNGSDYMKEAIDSALLQTYDNIEVIVVNDGSNDDGKTDSIARSYGDSILYLTKDNGGVSSALNMGIKNMTGEYFSWLSHDDVYEPNKVKNQVEAIDDAAVKVLVCCRYSQIDEQSRPINGYVSNSHFESDRVYSWQEALERLLKQSSISGCALLIPKSAFDECGLFSETLRFCQDTVMWYNIFLHGYSLRITNDISVKGRVHGKQLTQTGQSLFRYEMDMISVKIAKLFSEASDGTFNFLKLYLFENAKYLKYKRVKEIIDIGRTKGLVSFGATVYAYMISSYGKLRPYIRKAYYYLFRGIKTN